MKEGMAKLIIDIDEVFHKKIKMKSVDLEISIKDMVTQILEENLESFKPKKKS